MANSLQINVFFAFHYSNRSIKLQPNTCLLFPESFQLCLIFHLYLYEESWHRFIPFVDIFTTPPKFIQFSLLRNRQEYFCWKEFNKKLFLNHFYEWLHFGNRIFYFKIQWYKINVTEIALLKGFCFWTNFVTMKPLTLQA